MRSTDALFSVSLQDGQQLQIGVLLEHKSYPDADIRRQLLKYQANIYASQKKWAPLLVFVFYHGERRWDQPVTFVDPVTIDEKHRNLLLPKLLNFTYELFDLSSEEYTHLRLSLELRSILYVLRNIWRLHQAEYIHTLIDQFLSKLRSENSVLWGKIVDYLLHVIDLPIEKVIDYFPDVDKEEIMSTATRIEQKGIEKGIEKGRAEAIRMTALNFLKSGVSVAPIAKATGLSEREIEKIATENRG